MLYNKKNIFNQIYLHFTSRIQFFQNSNQFVTFQPPKRVVGNQIEIMMGKNRKTKLQGNESQSVHPSDNKKIKNMEMFLTYKDLRLRWRKTSPHSRKNMNIRRKWPVYKSSYPINVNTSAFIMHNNINTQKQTKKNAINVFQSTQNDIIDGYLSTQNDSIDGYLCTQNEDINNYLTTKNGDINGYLTTQNGDINGHLNTQNDDINDYLSTQNGDINGYSNTQNGDINGYLTTQNGNINNHLNTQDSYKININKEDNNFSHNLFIQNHDIYKQKDNIHTQNDNISAHSNTINDDIYKHLKMQNDDINTYLNIQNDNINIQLYTQNNDEKYAEIYTKNDNIISNTKTDDDNNISHTQNDDYNNNTTHTQQINISTHTQFNTQYTHIYNNYFTNKKTYIQPPAVYPPLNFKFDMQNSFCIFKTDVLHQHKVTIGDIVQAEKLHRRKAGEEIYFGTVLLVGTLDWTIIGKPTIPYAKVKAIIEQQTLTGEQISFKYKKHRRSSRFLRTRHWVTILRITEIIVDLNMKAETEPVKPKRLLDLWANRWLTKNELEGIQYKEDRITPVVEEIYDGTEHQPGSYHKRGLTDCYRFQPDPYATHWSP